MAQGGALTLAFEGNPITAGLNALVGLLGAIFSEKALIDRLKNQIAFFQSSQKSMARRGLFGSQVQRRGVKSREIWEKEQIGITTNLLEKPRERTLGYRDSMEARILRRELTKRQQRSRQKRPNRRGGGSGV